ncbi:unnamed protein product, partial [Choristocarpus tenellus]
MSEKICIALFDYKAQGPRSYEQLSFREGDQITLKRLPTSSNGEGWGLGELNGKSGWFPVNHVAISDQARAAVSLADTNTARVMPQAQMLPSQAPVLIPTVGGAGAGVAVGEDTVRALFNYKAEDTDEIGFFRGDLIKVLSRNGGWWRGTVGGKTGLFPSNYVEKYVSTTASPRGPAQATGSNSPRQSPFNTSTGAISVAPAVAGTSSVANPSPAGRRNFPLSTSPNTSSAAAAISSLGFESGTTGLGVGRASGTGTGAGQGKDLTRARGVSMGGPGVRPPSETAVQQLGVGGNTSSPRRSSMASGNVFGSLALSQG